MLGKKEEKSGRNTPGARLGDNLLQIPVEQGTGSVGASLQKSPRDGSDVVGALRRGGNGTCSREATGRCLRRVSEFSVGAHRASGSHCSAKVITQKNREVHADSSQDVDGKLFPIS
ncbi:uncharacterized protein [Melanerpes formicivorus]|uniref:uncharacterized protein isoform X3 n=1 Tax=Melanerpes formicivorus TaxID=211600 RepID=UPI00358F2823